MDSETPTPPSPAWHEDAIEVDRFLDGELDSAELARRRQDISGDPDLSKRVQERRRFLDELRRAGETVQAGARSSIPADLEGRVRLALARADRSVPSRRRWFVAAAAVLAAAVGTSIWLDREESIAMPPEVIKAADVARTEAEGPRGCRDVSATSPLHFPLVRDGSLKVLQCVKDGERTLARLYRPEELASIGYAAVADPSTPPGVEIGMTDLGDLVVYDVTYGRRRHYLAVSQSFLDRQRRLTPGRESCRACHNRSREGKPNPHNILKRSWKLGG